jgi:hypothetical protein
VATTAVKASWTHHRPRALARAVALELLAQGAPDIIERSRTVRFSVRIIVVISALQQTLQAGTAEIMRASVPGR